MACREAERAGCRPADMATSPHEGALTSLGGGPPLSNTGLMSERNVLGTRLEPCGTDPLTGFFRDGSCHTGPHDHGSHTVCAVVTAEFLDHQRAIGNDLATPMPRYRFPGLVPGDRWCVTAANWLRAHHDGVAAPVVMASTHERAIEVVPRAILQGHAVDVPADPGALERLNGPTISGILLSRPIPSTCCRLGPASPPRRRDRRHASDPDRRHFVAPRRIRRGERCAPSVHGRAAPGGIARSPRMRRGRHRAPNRLEWRHECPT